MTSSPDLYSFSVSLCCHDCSCIRPIGSKWKHNNQMGCNVLDTRRLCGEYHLFLCVCVFFFFFSYKNTLHMYIFDWSSDSSTKFSSASISLISHISQTILPKYLKKTWSRKQNKSRTIISQPCLSFETWPELGFKFWFCLLCSPAINNRNQTRACTTFRISFPFPITLLSLITEKMKGRCLSICRHLFSSLFRRSRCKLTLS